VNALNALTQDGLVHRLTRDDRPTTVCGRAEQVYVVTDKVTCPLCAVAQEPAPAHIGDDGWWVPKGGYSGKETLLELESRFGPNPPADPGEPYESEQEAAYWKRYRERHPDSTREWVVERAWRVRARTAREALDKAEPGAHDFVRVYEGTEPRPWEAT
jgi:hypothetical protein